MLKDRFLKAFGGLIALATIAFASLPTDALGVSASDYDYSSNPYNLGMFDTVNASARTITRQTGYFTLSSSLEWGLDSTVSTGIRVRIVHHFDIGMSFNGATNIRGFGYLNNAIWGVADDASNIHAWFWANTGDGITLSVPSSIASSVAEWKSFLSSNPLYLQYLTSSSTTQTFEDAINGQNASDAYQDGYDTGYADGASDSGSYTLTVYNDSSLAHVVKSVSSSDYSWGATPSYPGTSFVAGSSTYFSPGKRNVFYVQSNADYMDFTLNVGFGSGASYAIDCVSHGSSVDDPICLPYWEGNLSLHILGRNSSAEGYVMRQTFFAIGQEYLDGVECGMTYQRGYDDGYNAAVTTDNGIYIQWDTSVHNTDRTYTVTWYDSGNQIGSSTLSYYNSVVYFNRPYGHSYTWTITPNVAIPFTVTYSASGTGGNISSVLTSDMAVDDVWYLPFWEGSITLRVTPDDSTYGSISSYSFSLSNSYSSISNVKIGYGYASGYAKGYQDGLSEGQEYAYDSGYNNGADDGYDVGYSDGRSDGYADGWIAGGAGDTTLEVIDVWPLLSAVITMPFTFFSTGLDWTLFANTPYEFGVSAFFGSLLVVLMLWKIIQLIMGFGK